MSGIEIKICNNQDDLKIDRNQLTRTVGHVLQRMDVDTALVSLAVVDDQAIRELKGRYFDAPVVTDVLSFDLRDPDLKKSDSPPIKLDCEVVVNAQCASRNALDHNGDEWAELNLYVVHGLLHQLGYDDRTDRQEKIMHQKEDQLLEELGFGKVFGGTG